MQAKFINALQGCNLQAPPVWFMRQAGRHLASYRALRDKYSFLELCHNPDFIAKVTLLPLENYQVDAAILFSDILVILEAVGLGLHFEEKLGPIIDRPIASVKDINELPTHIDISKLQYVAEGIKALKPRLKVPLIGFCGAPFTVASYMIEGKSSRDLKKTKRWMLEDAQSFHLLLKKIADWSISYLKMQIVAGVDAIQIFDSWANTLAYNQFCEFSCDYIAYIIEALRSTDIPTIAFCRGSSVFASQLATIKPTCISLDWNCNITDIRKQVPRSIALQGNLDPSILYAPQAVIKKEVKDLLNKMAGDGGFIFNLGHGIPPDVSEEAVKTVVECIKGGS